ncbi:MAG: ribosome maturation factor RimM [Oscillospiraceae bacterium]|nr:ribosome maturation factor RimM [Oscillospiraceae bacterium]
MRKKYLQAGEVVALHGIKGEVKLYPWCDGPEFLKGLRRLYQGGDGAAPLEVKEIRAQKGMALLKLSGLDTPEQARQLIGKVLWLDRDEARLPPGRHFVQDMIGMTVRDAATGEAYGRIKDVQCPAGTDLYEISRQEGGTVLFPAVEEFLAGIDWEKDEVLVRPIEGMFDE